MRLAGSTGGTYTLSVIVLGANGNSEADTDFPATTATTGRVEVGASATGTLAGSERDYFRVDLEAGTRYQIDVEGADTGRGTVADPRVVLHDASNTQLGANDNSGVGKNAQMTYTPTAAGTYYVHVAGGNGTYTLSVREVTPPSTPGFGEGVAVLLSNLGQATNMFATIAIGTFDAAQGFTTGSERSGYFLDSIKLDIATVPKTPADVTVALWSAGSEGNPDASIATLTRSTGTWATGFNTFSAPPGKVLAAETKYFVVLFYSGDRPYLAAYLTGTDSADDASTGWRVTGRRLERGSDNEWSKVSGQYLKFSVSAAEVTPPDDSANVSEPDGEDLPAGTSTTGRVQVGGSVTGTIDSETDKDWFKVVLEAGKTYQFDMEGVDTERGTLTDPWLFLHNGPGTLILTYNDDRYKSRNSRIVHTATAAGAHYLEARGSVRKMGTYTLSAREITPADRVTPSDDPNRPQVTLHLSAYYPLEDHNRVMVTATVSPASTVPFTVEVSATPASPDGDFGDFEGPAQEDDFELSSNRTLRFAANATASTGTVTIRTIADDPTEPDELVTVSGTVSRRGHH